MHGTAGRSAGSASLVTSVDEVVVEPVVGVGSGSPVEATGVGSVADDTEPTP